MNDTDQHQQDKKGNGNVWSDEPPSVYNTEGFFAPAPTDKLKTLVSEYVHLEQRLKEISDQMNAPETNGLLSYFIDGNMEGRKYTVGSIVESLFDFKGAQGCLVASFWDKTLKITDVFDYMPAKRRQDWWDQIQNPLGKKPYYRKESEEWEIPPLPPFTYENVQGTVQKLLSERPSFFSERVDGVFKSLSREHVTNSPQAFNKRMIVPNVISEYGMVNFSTLDVIHDLRCVIAKFMGRGEPSRNSCQAIIEDIRQQNGVWKSVDGNAFRMRVYNGVGTAHIEINPEMAWKLNSVLAWIYPAAIPPELRHKPKRKPKSKDFVLFEQLLPFKILDILESMTKANKAGTKLSFSFEHRNIDKRARETVGNVLASIGGVKKTEARGDTWEFDYPPQEAIKEILRFGAVPDQKSHQYYPTPPNIAEIAQEKLTQGMCDADKVLEPSAGTGSLLAGLDVDQKNITCVEVSKLHCEVLKSKGYFVIKGDFIDASKALPKFERIILNPPFADGRWQTHLKAALSCLSDSGRLVAILPASAKHARLSLDEITNKEMDAEWSNTFSNQFEGTSASVVILTLERKNVEN